MLHATTHLHQVLENVPLARVIGLDVHQTHRDEQVPEGGTRGGGERREGRKERREANISK